MRIAPRNTEQGRPGRLAVAGRPATSPAAVARPGKVPKSCPARESCTYLLNPHLKLVHRVSISQQDMPIHLGRIPSEQDDEAAIPENQQGAYREHVASIKSAVHGDGVPAQQPDQPDRASVRSSHTSATQAVTAHTRSGKQQQARVLGS